MSDDIKKPLGTNIPMPKELMGKQFYTQEEMVMKSAKLDKLFFGIPLESTLLRVTKLLLREVPD